MRLRNDFQPSTVGVKRVLEDVSTLYAKQDIDAIINITNLKRMDDIEFLEGKDGNVQLAVRCFFYKLNDGNNNTCKLVSSILSTLAAKISSPPSNVQCVRKSLTKCVATRESCEYLGSAGTANIYSTLSKLDDGKENAPLHKALGDSVEDSPALDDLAVDMATNLHSDPSMQQMMQ